ncbi:T9SS type A sorting domain-containing protein [Chryseobacterium sp. MIQD13]|uniref:T9SS type A sorting domain-containing protein n=1 Tax=Chryseobacterium sp. MIQD13 TaxID=3422310 RepID=UPI003D2AA7A5
MGKNQLISACLLLSSIALNAQTEFTVVSGMGTRLYDINSNGNAVHSGGYYSYNTSTSTAIESVASATNRLNNTGNIAGSMPFVATDGSNLDQAAYRKNGNWTAIGYFPGDTPGNSWFGEAKGISESSVYVTGQMTSSNAGSSYPFLYNTESGALTKLTGDLLYTNARGAAVNDNGVVAGWIDREDIFGMGTFRVPAYFDTGGTLHYIDFGTPEYGEANDVSNAGLVVGNKGSKAFIYNINTGIYQSFDAPAGYTDAVFVSVSENGAAVGYCGMIGDREVIIYHPSLGPAPVLLTDLLTAQGITLNTFDGKLGTGMGISSDGKYICGFDNSVPPIFAEGWVAKLGETVLAANDIRTAPQNLRVYPNPVKDFLHISGEKEIKSVSVYSAEGRLVLHNITVNSKEAKIDLSGLETGNYFASATLDDGSIKSFKILKK